MKIFSMEPLHFEAMNKIYTQGINSGNATFQTEAPSWKTWNDSHLKMPRLVATEDNQIIGWAALTHVSDRCAYAGVAEVSVYVATDHQGKGIGKRLLEELVLESEKHNLWTLQAGIFPENKASLKIHKTCGFRQIGYREKIGKLNGIWRDTILLERRSKVIE